MAALGIQTSARQLQLLVATPALRARVLWRRRAAVACGPSPTARRKTVAACASELANKSETGRRSSKVVQRRAVPPSFQKRQEAVAINKKITRSRNVEELETLVLREIASFSPVNISTAAARLAKQRHGSPKKAAKLVELLSGAATAKIHEFQGRQLSNFAWATAKIGFKGCSQDLRDDLIQALELRAVECWKEGTFQLPQELSILLWSFAKLAHSPVMLLDAIEQDNFSDCELLGHFGPQEVSNTAWALAKLGENRSSLLDPLASQAKAVVDSAAPKEISITLWSFAKLQHMSPSVEAMLEAFVDETEDALNTYSPMDLSNLAYACAHLKTCGSKAVIGLMGMVIAEASPRLCEFSPQGIANFTWSMAKAGAATPEAMDDAALAVDERVCSLTAQGWANILWAFAKAGLPITPKVEMMLDSVSSAAAADSSALDSQNMANIVWALGSLEHYSLAADHLLDVVSKESILRRNEFTPQGISNLLYGFAKLEACSRKGDALANAGSNTSASLANVRTLFSHVTPRIIALGPQLSAQDVAQISWAAGRVGFFHQELLDCLASRAEAVLEDFSPQGVSNTLWAFATLKRYPVSLLDAFASRVVSGGLSLSDYSGQGIANLAWAYAKLDYVKPAGFMDRLSNEAASRLDEFDAQSICSLVASAADLVCPCQTLFEAIDTHVLTRLPEFRGGYSESLMASYSALGYQSSAALPLLGQAAEAALQTLADAEPGFFGAAKTSKWDKRRCKHYTALMVEIFCSGSLPNMPNSDADGHDPDQIFPRGFDTMSARTVSISDENKNGDEISRKPPRKL